MSSAHFDTFRRFRRRRRRRRPFISRSKLVLITSEVVFVESAEPRIDQSNLVEQNTISEPKENILDIFEGNANESESS